MTITLLAVSLNDSPLTQPITASFDARGGTIGRADHNTMALPDPERHISRLQAEVASSGAHYSIKNVGAANPIVVAGRQLLAGESAPLCHHDEIRIGGYLLRVIDDDHADTHSAEITRGRAIVRDHLDQQLTSPGMRQVPKATVQPAHSPVPGPLSGRDLAGVFGGADAGNALSRDNPFADLLGSNRAEPPRAPAGGTRPIAAASSDPFADLLAPPSGVSSGSQALPSPAGPARTAVLPDDFDPFAATPVPKARSPAPATSDPFADLLPSQGSQSIDDMFGIRPSTGGDDALARFSGDRQSDAFAPPVSGAPTDALDLFGGGSAPQAADSAPFSNHSSDLRASFVPPKWVAPEAPVPSSPEPGPAPTAIPSDATWLRPRPKVAGAAQPVEAATAPAPASTPAHEPLESAVGARATRPMAEAAPVVDRGTTSPDVVVRTGAPAVSDEALWQAFCEGARVSIPLPHGLDEATMRSLGRLLHAAVAGTLQLIAVRASTKQELRADVTMIQPRANNPLKFSPDVQTGLEQLLGPPMRGFLAGPEAMTDAMNDLVGHSIGTMAGMRAALDGVLARFAPPQLEAKLTGTSLLDSLLPMNRRARLWDLYLKHFDTIREEAQDDFHTLFGKAFLAAYEQQIDRLRASRPTK